MNKRKISVDALGLNVRDVGEISHIWMATRQGLRGQRPVATDWRIPALHGGLSLNASVRSAHVTAISYAEKPTRGTDARGVLNTPVNRDTKGEFVQIGAIAKAILERIAK